MYVVKFYLEWEVTVSLPTIYKGVFLIYYYCKSLLKSEFKEFEYRSEETGSIR